jgi:hypothetical protein
MSSRHPKWSRTITIEGLTPEEFLGLPDEHFAALIAAGPIVFKVGTANVLGQVRLGDESLTIELAQIDGGGEGVLLTLSLLAEALARQRGIGAIEWIVHAVSCAKPNLKLRRVLERRGFMVKELPGVGAAYYCQRISGETIRGYR